MRRRDETRCVPIPGQRTRDHPRSANVRQGGIRVDKVIHLRLEKTLVR